MLRKDDIINAIQNSSIFLRIPELRNATVKLKANGQPCFFTGGFTMVFQLIKKSKKWAFRVWYTGFNQQKNRFQKVSKYLKKRKLPYFADFIYDEKGLLVNGKLVDTIRMEWFEYDLLKDYIEKNLNDKQKLQKLADNFKIMCGNLHKHKISHGDLQHGNILVDNKGNIKLIDYDSVCIPDIEGQEELVIGLKGYQHPSRFKSANKASLKADYFSELIIYLSLYSIAENPRLWDNFNVKDTETLLFNQEDFVNIKQSNIYKKLSEINSNTINALLKICTNYLGKQSYLDLEPFYSFSFEVLILQEQLEKERTHIVELQQQNKMITTEKEYITKERDKERYAYDKINSELTQKVKKIKELKKWSVTAFVLGISVIITIILFETKTEKKQLLFEQESLKIKNNQLMINYNNITTELDNLKSQNRRLTTERNNAITERDNLRNQKEQLVKFWRPEVTSLKVGNWNNNMWLTEPGKLLSAKKMRYFVPIITYNSIISKDDVTLFVKIIKPDGKLSWTENKSPNGYSYKWNGRINSGFNQSLNLDGWGNSNGTAYEAGEYIVEVWHNYICLLSKKIKIDP